MTQKRTTFIKQLINIEGDKIIWMIYLFLMAATILLVSSSTYGGKNTRLEYVYKQFQYAFLGLAMAFCIYRFFSLNLIKKLSAAGFLVSVPMLLFLILELSIGSKITVPTINNAKRVILVFGKQIHVLELVKVAMVMYFAWGIAHYKENKEDIITRLSRIKKPAVLKNDFIRKTILFYCPLAIIFALTAGSSFFSALFISGVCFLMLLIAEIPKIKEILLALVVFILLIAGVYVAHTASGGKYFSHFSSALNRFEMNYEKKLEAAEGTPEFREVLDKVTQPISGKIAISEGGFFGKGPGNSTQTYVVPLMFSDYMFSFIVEEYGLLGTIFILLLYCSLPARGQIIVKHCKDLFSQMAVTGICIMITGQAILHILVNVGIIPLSGQTLPLLSDGSFALLMFSTAFGILLNISKNAKQGIEQSIKTE